MLSRVPNQLTLFLDPFKLANHETAWILFEKAVVQEPIIVRIIILWLCISYARQGQKWLKWCFMPHNFYFIKYIPDFLNRPWIVISYLNSNTLHKEESEKGFRVSQVRVLQKMPWKVSGISRSSFSGGKSKLTNLVLRKVAQLWGIHYYFENSREKIAKNTNCKAN